MRGPPRCGHAGGCSPAGVPADGAAFAAPEIVHLAEKRVRFLHHRFPALRNVLRHGGKHGAYLRLVQADLAAVGADKLGKHLCVFRLQHLGQRFALALAEMVEVRHFGRFFACDRDMEDGFGVVLVLDRLHIPAYLVHIPEHLPDEVDAAPHRWSQHL